MIIVRLVKKYVAMYPKAKKHGWYYFWNKDFRKRIRNRERYLKQKNYLGYIRYNRKGIKKKLAKVNGTACYWCREWIDWQSPATTIDHKIPQSKGGSKKLENLRLLHETCRVEHDQATNQGIIRK